MIPLAPAGIAGVALVRLVQGGEGIGVIAAGAVPIASIVAAALAGFGIWYTLLAAMFLQRYRRLGPLPFHPGWWGFTFPLGAMGVALALQAEVWGAVSAGYLGAAYLAALLVAWSVVATHSIRAVRS